jgi:hypothetical protein
MYIAIVFAKGLVIPISHGYQGQGILTEGKDQYR